MHKGAPEKLQNLQQITAYCLSNGKAGKVAGTELPLVLCLNHPSHELRRSALLKLFEDFQKNEGGDIDFYRESLLARLQDSNKSVVNTVLERLDEVTAVLTMDDIKTIAGNNTKIKPSILNVLTLKVLERVEASSLAEYNDFFFKLLADVFVEVAKPTEAHGGVMSELHSHKFNVVHPILAGIMKALPSNSSNGLSSGEMAQKQCNLLLERVSEKIDWDMYLELMKHCEKILPNSNDGVLNFLSRAIALENVTQSRYAVGDLLALNLNKDQSNTIQDDYLEVYKQLGTSIEAKEFLFQNILMKNDAKLDLGLANAVLLKFLLQAAKGLSSRINNLNNF